MSDHAIRTEISIAAPPAVVWQVLLDFSRFPSWNSILRVRGEARVGARTVIRVRLPGGLMPPIPVRFCSVDHERRLAWKGGIGHLFHAEHSFALEPNGEGGTRFVHVEEFDGAAAALLAPRPFLKTMTRNYQRMNEELKARSEQQLRP